MHYSQFVYGNLIGTGADTIHPANTFHLIFCYGPLGYALRCCHMSGYDFAPLKRRLIKFVQMLMQFA